MEQPLTTWNKGIANDALYAAARKALTAVLVQHGLRPTRGGGHEAVIEAADAQLAAAIVEAAAKVIPNMPVYAMRR